METRIDTKAPVWLPTSPIIGGSFLMNRPRRPDPTATIGGFRQTPWNKDGHPDGCRKCGSLRYPPKVFGVCSECFADLSAVIQHEERLAV